MQKGAKTILMDSLKTPEPEANKSGNLNVSGISVSKTKQTIDMTKDFETYQGFNMQCFSISKLATDIIPVKLETLKSGNLK